ncbi:unnamed protein product [Prunus armeniaca]
MQIDEDPSWQDPIIDYLVNGNLPTDKSEARKVQQKAARYYMHSSKLIRRSYSIPYLTCIKYPQTLEVLCKIHDGECGNHSRGRSLTQTPLNMSKNVIVANDTSRSLICLPKFIIRKTVHGHSCNGPST